MKSGLVLDGAALLVCPEAPLPVSRVCHDPEEMQRVYDLGRTAGEKALASVKEFLAGMKHLMN